MLEKLKTAIGLAEQFAIRGQWDGSRMYLEDAIAMVAEMQGPTERPDTWDQLSEAEIAALICDDRR